MTKPPAIPETGDDVTVNTEHALLNKIGHQNKNTIVGCDAWTPNDQFFLTGKEWDWWYFNHHRVLHAHQLYGHDWSMAGPVAIIEEYMNLTPYTDTPNFLREKAFVVNEDTTISSWKDDPAGMYPHHGNLVAYLIGGKKNTGVGLCGFAPGIPVVPVKAKGYLAIARAVDYIRENRLAKVISISKCINVAADTQAPVCTADYPLVSQAIKRAIDANIAVVCSAGNTYKNLDRYNFNREGEIVVGGISKHGREWKSDTTIDGTNFGNVVDLAAASVMYIFGYDHAGNGVLKPDEGCSFATPLVAATAAMMQYLSPDRSLVPKKLREILIHSCYLAPAYNNQVFLGAGLNSEPQTHFKNVKKIARIRVLDVHNALTIARYANDRIWRAFNTDDTIWTVVNSNFSQPAAENGRLTDSLYTLSPELTTGEITGWVYNRNNCCSAGYQLYRRGSVVLEHIDGTVRNLQGPLNGLDAGVLYETTGSGSVAHKEWGSPAGIEPGLLNSEE